MRQKRGRGASDGGGHYIIMCGVNGLSATCLLPCGGVHFVCRPGQQRCSAAADLVQRLLLILAFGSASAVGS